MNILHANTDPTLVARLKQMLAHASRADIAVGYLFLSGFNAVAEELSRLEKVRVLVGRADRQTLEEVARGLQQAEALQARVEGDDLIRRSLRVELGSRAVETVALGVSLLPQSDEAQAGVAKLSELIEQGKLEIKTYPKGVLHAKAYLCWYKDHAEPGSAIVGSSNFTLAGFTGNTELNVRVTGDAEMAELQRWFDALWADAVDVTRDIAVTLRRSWAIAQPPPYHVYLKALYELHRQELELPELEPERRGAPDLANFQLDAVRRGLAMVRQYGGCFVGDVVGLGKTYIGAELVRQLQYEEPRGSHPLIICPAGLQPMWQRINELFGLGAAIVSMTALTPPTRTPFDEDEADSMDSAVTARGVDLLQQFPNRGVVLRDEVHNFRNPNTGRYRALAYFLASGEHKTVLLSATPQNLGPADIYHQLRLFLDDLDHKLDIEPLHLESYFQAVQQWYEFQIESDNYQNDYRRWQQSVGQRGVKRRPEPVAPQPPSTPRATIVDVLRPVFVRRRRGDIRELYGTDIEISGKPVRFPEPVLDNLFYRLDKVYARAGRFADLQTRLQQHRGARYLAVAYLQPDARQKPHYRDLLRARNRVAALMKALLFKRLESSVAAFRATLDTLSRSNRNFRAALDGGVVPIGRTATGLLAGETFDLPELLQRLEQEEQRRQAANAPRARLVHPVEDFDTVRWVADLDADFAVLEGLRADVSAIEPEDDDKLRALKQFLARPDVAAGRLLIFSEAAATVDYLFDQLNPGGDDPSVARLSGSTVTQLQQVVKRFAPAANVTEGEVMPGPPVRVLITTDVVSEGQNLQDCNRVLNYDLHWNPVRLIQRFGRVDRIGTTYQQIFLHNTWPDTDVDAGLSLTQRLGQRIQSFHDFIGLDTPLLSADERLNPNAMYRIYEQKQLPERDDVLDEVAAFQRGVALLQRTQQEDPELWKTVTSLPDGIRSALPARVTAVPQAIVDYQMALPGLELQQPLMTLETVPAPVLPPSSLDSPRPGETITLFKHGERPAAYAVGSDLGARSVSLGQLLAAMECTPETPAAPLPEDTNARVMAAYRAMRQDTASRLGRSRRPSGDTRLRRYLSRELRSLRTLERDEDELRRIGILQQIYLDYLPSHVIADLEDTRRLDLGGDALIRRLEALRERHHLQPPAENADEPSAATDVIRVVCSDGLAAE